jgi:cytochrome P450
MREQCFLFLVAGYETTSTLLTNCAYLMAVNTEKQTKLLDEIEANVEDEVMNIYYDYPHDYIISVSP